MSDRLLIVIIFFPIWLTLVFTFRKARQWLFYYLFASFGATLMMVLVAEYFGLDQIMVNVGSFHTHLLAEALGIPNEILSSARLILPAAGGGSTILKLGIECSAILEMSILFSLLFFYPAFRPSQKLLKIVFGLAATYTINVFRMFIILYITYRFGSGAIYLAHALVARFFFFAAVITLYWYIITKPSIRVAGMAIRKQSRIDQLTQKGREISVIHSLFQTVIVGVILFLGFISFQLFSDWQVSFGGAPISKEEKPLIYLDETDVLSPKEIGGEQSSLARTEPMALNQKEGLFEFQNWAAAELSGLTAKGPGAAKFSLAIDGKIVKEGWLDRENQESTWSAIRVPLGAKVTVKIIALEDTDKFKLNLKLRNLNEQ